MAKRGRNDLLLKLPKQPVVLGTGGFATVFIGTYNGKDVAVKRVANENLSDKFYEESIKSCDREEFALKTLRHSNIIELYGMDEDDYFK